MDCDDGVLVGLHKVVVIMLPLSLVLLVLGWICGLVSSLTSSPKLLTGSATYFIICSKYRTDQFFFFLWLCFFLSKVPAGNYVHGSSWRTFVLCVGSCSLTVKAPLCFLHKKSRVFTLCFSETLEFFSVSANNCNFRYTIWKPFCVVADKGTLSPGQWTLVLQVICYKSGNMLWTYQTFDFNEAFWTNNGDKSVCFFFFFFIKIHLTA